MPTVFIPTATSLAELAGRTTVRRSGLFGLRRRAEVTIRSEQLAGPELYHFDGVLHRIDGPPEQPFFLDYDQYLAIPFHRAVVRDVVSTRHAKGVAAPWAGFVEEFNVGGVEHLRHDLLTGDLTAKDDGWSLDLNDTEVLPGLSVPFCHYGYCAFGHFVLDGLLQIYLFRSELSRGEAQLVHWPLERTWMAPALEACGVPARARRELRRPAALMRRAGLSSALAAHGVYYPNSLSHDFFAWLRGLFGGEREAGTEKIYVRRDPASGREVRRQDELEQVLRDRGFRIISAESLSLPDQVRLFTEAETVVSPFGSGLTLAPLLGGARNVVELLPSTTTDAWFTRQAAVHRLRYHPIVHASDPDGSFEADLERVDRVLAGLPSSTG